MFQNLDKSLLLSLIKTLLIIVFPFINYLAVNYDYLSGKFVYFTLLTSVATFLTLYFICSFLSKVTKFRDFNRMLFIFDIAYLLAFLFLPIVDFGKVVVSLFELTRGATVVYAIVCIVIITFSFFISKYKLSHVFLFLFAFIVISFNATKISWRVVRGNSSEYIPHKADPVFNNPIIRDKRNIYYIIIDEYSAPKILKKELSWRSDNFLKELSGLGYYHAKNAFSTYSSTRFTLASIFAIDYILDENSPSYYNRHEDFYPGILRKQEMPELIRMTNIIGYEFYIFGNMWAGCSTRGKHIRCVEGTDNVIPYHIILFLSNTPIVALYNKFYKALRRLSNDDNYGESYLKKRFKGNDTLNRVLSYLRLNGTPSKPSFMFIHSLVPHQPFVFKPNCDIKDLTGAKLSMNTVGRTKKTEKYKNNPYLDGIQCSNKRIIEFAKFIEKNDPEAIVVIQGDHGFRGWPDSRNLILNLFRVPHTCKKYLYPEINNINSVRLALSCAIGQKPIFVENKSYASIKDKNNIEAGFVRRLQILTD